MTEHAPGLWDEGCLGHGDQEGNVHAGAMKPLPPPCKSSLLARLALQLRAFTTQKN